MFNWLFGNQFFRGAANRSAEKLAKQFGPGPATGILALALAHACYPDATSGDNAVQDDMVTKLKQLKTRPCNAQLACKYVEQWLDLGTLSTLDAFESIWGFAPDEFLASFFDA